MYGNCYCTAVYRRCSRGVLVCIPVAVRLTCWSGTVRYGMVNLKRQLSSGYALLFLRTLLVMTYTKLHFCTYLTPRPALFFFWGGEFTQPRVVVPNRRFGTTYRPNLQGHCLTLENGTDSFSLNVGTEQPLYAA
jgi:hypothetical protein